MRVTLLVTTWLAKWQIAHCLTAWNSISIGYLSHQSACVSITRVLLLVDGKKSLRNLVCCKYLITPSTVQNAWNAQPKGLKCSTWEMLECWVLDKAWWDFCDSHDILSSLLSYIMLWTYWKNSKTIPVWN